ncbi:unnamed protein product [[Actinomadura] parvosata subsp. kistnae]|uniref:Uncharacterized protein n=1 Tax=[Actinomadura] parvosata subsp. kistnae TaxID=1909395 RepID=A0A1V0ABU3_9ACTN|nr:hypothetical protein [Nonomuraea sp. ATCC 55076]AQZ67656.1 hypothetical protein BKM31_44870 [Nonomuraea sp. ATCC 55076]SPL94056.1 unnamed protein product [Actinomadura parvosata subsp. kistnae]
MNANVPQHRCTVYDWCTSSHQRPNMDHRDDIDLIEHIDDRNVIIEVGLFAPADGSAPPSIRVAYPGGDAPYIDLDNHVAGAFVDIIRMFEGPGLNDRRGLRDFSTLLFIGASRISGVTEL